MRAQIRIYSFKHSNNRKIIEKIEKVSVFLFYICSCIMYNVFLYCMIYVYIVCQIIYCGICVCKQKLIKVAKSVSKCYVKDSIKTIDLV